MVNTSFATSNVAYAQPRSASAATTPQASVGQQESFVPSSREEAVSPQVAYADTASPSINPARMETSFGTMVLAGVCALVIFSCCCAGNQNGNGGR